MEKNMETTIGFRVSERRKVSLGFGGLGFRAWGYINLDK